MKKLFYSVFMGLAMIACHNEDGVWVSTSNSSEKGEFNVSVMDDGISASTRAGQSYTVTGTGQKVYDSEATVVVTPNTGYYLESMSVGTGSNASIKSKTVDSGTGFVQQVRSDVVFNVSVVPNPVMTITASEGGSVTAGGSARPGTTKSVVATPSSGYDFSGWVLSGGSDCGSVANVGIASTEYTFGTSDATLKANFTKRRQIRYTITYTSKPTYSGNSVSPNIAFYSDSPLPFTLKIFVEGYAMNQKIWNYNTWTIAKGTSVSTCSDAVSNWLADGSSIWYNPLHWKVSSPDFIDYEEQTVNDNVVGIRNYFKSWDSEVGTIQFDDGDNYYEVLFNMDYLDSL